MKDATGFEVVVWDKPWLEKNSVKWLEGWVRKNFTAFEWGMGGSTLWLARHCAHVTSVEHDPAWIIGVREALRERDLLAKASLFVESVEHGTDAYVGVIDLYDRMYDLILIDGSEFSRNPAAPRAVAHCKDHGIVILDNSGSAPHVPAREYLDGLIARGGWRVLRWVGFAEQPEGIEPPVIETSIYINDHGDRAA